MSNLNYKLDLLMDARDEMRRALLGKGQVVNNDLRTYAQAIRDISGGGVRLFESQQEMEESINNVEGMYGIVYSRNIVFIEPNYSFNTLYFPERIYFDSAIVPQLADVITIEIPTSLFLLSYEINPRGIVSITITMNNDTSIQFNVIYESQNGLTFYRNTNTFEDSWEINEVMWDYDSETGIVDLNNICVAGDYSISLEVRAVLEKFATTFNRDFEGFYQYREDVNYKYLYGIKDIHMIEPPQGQLVSEFTFTKNALYLPKFSEAVDDMLIETGMNGIYANMYYDESTHKIYLDNMESENTILEAYERDTWNKFLSMEDSQNSDVDCVYYEIDPFEGKYIGRRLSSTSLYSSYQTHSGTGTTYTYYIHKLEDLTGNFYHLGTLEYSMAETSHLTINNIWGNVINIVLRPDDTTSQPRFPYTANVGDDEDTSFVIKTDWYNAKTSFTLEKSSQLLPHIKGFGVNGLVEGDDNIYKVINTYDYMKYNGVEPIKDYTVAVSSKRGNYVGNVNLLTDCLMDVKKAPFDFPEEVDYWEVLNHYAVGVKYNGYKVYILDIQDSTIICTFDTLSNTKNGVGKSYINVANYGSGDEFHILQQFDSDEFVFINILGSNISYTIHSVTVAVNSCFHFAGKWFVVATDDSTTVAPFKMKLMSFDLTEYKTVKTLPGNSYADVNMAYDYFYTYSADSWSAKFTVPEITGENTYKSVLYGIEMVPGGGYSVQQVLFVYTAPYRVILTNNGYMLHNKQVYELEEGAYVSLQPISGCDYTDDLDTDVTFKYVGNYYKDTKTFMYYKDNKSDLFLSDLKGSTAKVTFDDVYPLIRNSNNVHNNKMSVVIKSNTTALVYVDVFDRDEFLLRLYGVVYFDRGITTEGVMVRPLFVDNNKKVYMYIPEYGILNDPRIDYTDEILGN